MFDFPLLTEQAFYDLVDQGRDHPVFAWMLSERHDNDPFFDGATHGYKAFYCVSEDRPTSPSAHSLYLFLKGVFMQEGGDDVKGAAFPGHYAMGYAAGWSIALGENRRDLFHAGKKRGFNGYARLLDPSRVEVLDREEYRARHVVQYVLKDEQGFYVAEVDSQGVICSCDCSGTAPECEHVCLVERISPWFNGDTITRPAVATTGD